jgi:hypothetical protein
MASGDSTATWNLSSIWFSPFEEHPVTTPLSVFLPIGLYGKIYVYLSKLQLTATARCVHGSFFTVHVDYVSRWQTLFRGPLGSGTNVRILRSPLSFNESHLAALWSPPYIR